MSKDLATAFCEAQSRAERAEARVAELEAALHDIRSVAPDRDDATYLYAFEKVLDIARAALVKGE